MTVKIYTTTSNSSSRKAVAYLKENDVDFVEKKLTKEFMTYKEFLEVLTLSENGSEDIISTDSMAYKEVVEGKLNLDDITLKQLYELLQQYPRMMKYPVFHDGKNLQVGYNAEEIGYYRSKRNRKKEMEEILKELDSQLTNEKVTLEDAI